MSQLPRNPFVFQRALPSTIPGSGPTVIGIVFEPVGPLNSKTTVLTRVPWTYTCSVTALLLAFGKFLKLKVIDEHVATTEPFGRSCETASAVEEPSAQTTSAVPSARASEDPHLRVPRPGRRGRSDPALAGRRALAMRPEVV